VILDIPRCDGVGKPPKKTHTWSSGTGVRTQDFPNVKCRARPLATVLVLFCGWNPWSYTFPVGRSRFLSAGTARSGGSLRGDDAWAGEDGATGALLWWTLEDLFKRSGYTSNFQRNNKT
jgi:hypothetical protein